MSKAVLIGASRRLSAVLLAGHFAAVVCVLAVPLPTLFQGLVGLALLISLAGSLWHHALRRASRAIVAIEPMTDGWVAAHCRDGRCWTGRVAQDSFVSPAWVVLRIVPDGMRRARTVVIPGDAVQAEAFRRLRVWLRWGVPAVGPGAATHDPAPSV